MGCSCVKSQPEFVSSSTTKPFSWEQRQSNDLKLLCALTINGAKDEEILRGPGEIGGQHFAIENCRNSEIHIYDYLNSVTVDDCESCTIILGSVKGSVFLRNCVRVTCVSYSGQFRMRDCRKCNCFVFSATQPVIEASTGIVFGSNRLDYSDLSTQLISACLNPSINSWSEVHDFTPVTSETNWKFEENDKFKLKTRSKNFEVALKNLGVKWAGKSPSSILLESTV